MYKIISGQRYVNSGNRYYFMSNSLAKTVKALISIVRGTQGKADSSICGIINHDSLFWKAIS